MMMTMSMMLILIVALAAGSMVIASLLKLLLLVVVLMVFCIGVGSGVVHVVHVNSSLFKANVKHFYIGSVQCGCIAPLVFILRFIAAPLATLHPPAHEIDFHIALASLSMVSPERLS
jgi:hypothetical protein